jgi:hypothetical protein
MADVERVRKGLELAAAAVASAQVLQSIDAGVTGLVADYFQAHSRCISETKINGYSKYSFWIHFSFRLGPADTATTPPTRWLVQCGGDASWVYNCDPFDPSCWASSDIGSLWFQRLQ